MQRLGFLDSLIWSTIVGYISSLLTVSAISHDVSWFVTCMSIYLYMQDITQGILLKVQKVYTDSLKNRADSSFHNVIWFQVEFLDVIEKK